MNSLFIRLNLKLLKSFKDLNITELNLNLNNISVMQREIFYAKIKTSRLDNNLISLVPNLFSNWHSCTGCLSSPTKSNISKDSFAGLHTS